MRGSNFLLSVTIPVASFCLKPWLRIVNPWESRVISSADYPFTFTIFKPKSKCKWNFTLVVCQSEISLNVGPYILKVNKEEIKSKLIFFSTYFIFDSVRVIAIQKFLVCWFYWVYKGKVKCFLAKLAQGFVIGFNIHAKYYIQQIINVFSIIISLIFKIY